MNGQKLKKCSEVHAEFIFIVDTLHTELDKDDFKVMAMVARNLWFRRNSLVHEGGRILVIITKLFIMQLNPFKKKKKCKSDHIRREMNVQ